MSTLPLLVCAVLAASPPVQRVPPVKDPVARVVALMGAVTAKTASQATIPVAVGTYFDADDTLTVGPGAWVAVVLKNEHLVRLDDDLELRLSEVALFKAEPPKATFEMQLNRLLATTERVALKSERLIGWHAGLAAANTASREPEPPPPPPKKKPAAPPAPAPAPATEPTAQAPRGGSTVGGNADPANNAKLNAPGRPRGAPAPAPGSQDEVAREPSGDTKKKAPGGLESDARRDEREGERPTTERPREEPAALVADDELRACLRQDLAQHYPEFAATLTEVTLFITLKQGDPAVRLQGGLTAPVCARNWAKARRAQLNAERTALQVTLSPRALGPAPTAK